MKNRSREVAARGTSSTFPQHLPGFQRLHRRGRASGAKTDVPRGQQWKPEGRKLLSIITILVIVILVLIVLYLLRRVF